ncbi:hypothetical protein [Bacillus toyonensis]|uniref:hypothetical protein n=1 Tax=Bacillus toyonensis TaxID=155322 RepID=UPI00211D7F13|nr:hypothetical protein [Bacillus toyonensis]
MESLLLMVAVGLGILIAWKIVKTVIVRCIVIAIAIGIFIVGYDYVLPAKFNMNPYKLDRAYQLSQETKKVRVVEADGEKEAQVYFNDNWYYIKDLDIEKDFKTNSYMVKTKGDKFKIEDKELVAILETLK